MTTNIEKLVEMMPSMPGVAFGNEAVVWAERCGDGAAREILAYLEHTNDRMGALSVLSAISRECDSEFPTEQPIEARAVLPDGRIRYGDPNHKPTQLMPDRFKHLEEIFRELRGD